MAEDTDLGNGVSAGETESNLDLEAAMEDIAEGLGFTPDTDESGDVPASGEADADAGKPTDSPAASEASPEGDAVPPAATVEPAPKTWRPEAAKDWDKLPENVRAEITKREEDMFKGIEGYKADASIGKVVKDIVAPYLTAMQTRGQEPVAQIRSLLHANHVIENGTMEQKVAVFQKLAENYGIQFNSGDAPYVDPQTQELKKTIDELRSRLDTNDNKIVETTKAALKQEIDTFAADPAHPYFDEVANDIAALLRAKSANNLQEAYDKAIWMNPVTRAKESARLAAEAATKAKSDAEEKAKAAAKASGANVRTSTKPGRGTAPVGSMDDTLTETLANIKTRA